MVPINFITGDDATPVELNDGSVVTLKTFREVVTEIVKIEQDREDLTHRTLWQLSRKCSDPEHELFGWYGQKLIDRDLLGKNEQPTEEVRCLVSNIIEVHGIEVRFNWPTDLSHILVT